MALLKKPTDINSVANWLWRTMWNCLKSAARRTTEYNLMHTDLFDNEGECVREPVVCDDEVTDHSEIIARLDGLDELDRQRVYAHVIEGVSIDDLAKREGVPYFTMAKRIQASLGRARRLYQDVA